MIGILDYGVGNLHSVTNALKYIGLDSEISDDRAVLERADALILPGVGAFPDAAGRLKNSGLDTLLKETKKPVLGICLGMQLLFDNGLEIRDTAGLGLIQGTVSRITTGFKLPHIGWNSLTLKAPCPLTKGVEDGSYVYFVHSFAASLVKPESIAAVTDYGCEVTAMAFSGNVFGCQFHPEKSGEPGLLILRNFGGLF